MADIFLSYSREDRAAVEPLGEQLAAAGYSVWWDKQLTGGTRYLEATEAELNAAKVVLVAWSKTSIASHWVADEAGAGRDTGRLLPISLDGSMPPLGFRQFQVIEFSKWAHDHGEAFGQLTDALGKLTAASGEASVTQKKLAAKPLFRQPFVLGGIAMAAGALVAVAALFAVILMGSKPEAAAGKLTAFFGFTASGDDPTVRTIAEAATAETFKTFSVLGLETASEASTRDVALAGQLAAAKSLKARYALGGEVRKTASGYDIAIRIDDVDSGKTLWREAMSGGAAQTTSLPVAAAAQASTTIDCLIRVLDETGRPTEAVLAILPRACASFQLGAADRITVWRQAAKLLPNSAHAHDQLSSALYASTALNPDARRHAFEAEAKEEARLALNHDPKSGAQDTLLRLSLGQVPLAEVEKRYAEALTKTADMDPQAIGRLEFGYGLLMMMVGRIEDAVPHMRRAAQANSLSYPLLIQFGHALMQNGLTLEGRSVFEQTNSRLPSSFGWVFWITNEVGDPEGDADHALKVAPVSVSGDMIACYRDYAAAANLRAGPGRRAAATRVRACMGQTGFGLIRVVGPLALLGDVDGAFQRIEQVMGSGTGIALTPMVSELLSREAPAMRADPRFLPLVKKTGQYQYWLDTGTQPDACKRAEERDFEVCTALRKDQAAR